MTDKTIPHEIDEGGWEEWKSPDDTEKHAGDLVEMMNLDTRGTFQGIVTNWNDMLMSGGIVNRPKGGEAGTMDSAIAFPRQHKNFGDWAKNRRFRVIQKRNDRLGFSDEEKAA